MRCSRLFIKRTSNQHNFLLVSLVLRGVVFLFYLVEGIFCTAVAEELKLEDKNGTRMYRFY